MCQESHVAYADENRILGPNFKMFLFKDITPQYEIQFR